jgi:hypothetical protein
MTEALVSPGGIATLEFELAPGISGRTEYFQLVIEGKHWLPDTSFQLTVAEPACRFSTAGAQLASIGGAGKVRLEVEDGVAWEITSDSTWLRVAPEWGVGSCDLVLEAAPNPGQENRAAVVRCGPASFKISQAAEPDPVKRLATAGAYAFSGRTEPSSRAATADPVGILERLWESSDFRDCNIAAWTAYHDAAGVGPTWAEWDSARSRLLSGEIGIADLCVEYRKRVRPVPGAHESMTEPELLFHLTFGAFERRFPRAGERRSYLCEGISLAESCLRIPAVRAILVSAEPVSAATFRN